MDANSEAPSLTLQAPAKVNLRLEVLNRREDGYHDLHMLMAPVSLCDTLRLRTLPEPGHIQVTLAGAAAAVAPGADNLCHGAARFYFAETGVQGGVAVELTKRVPAGAGLGGGSSDAAATVLGLERLYGRQLSAAARRRAAFAVGADVPFFFARAPAWVGGIGEVVEPVAELEAVWMVLVFPGVFLSTPKVFSLLRRRLTTPRRPPTIAQFNFRGLVAGLYNELQAPALEVEPAVGVALDALSAAGAAGQLMSGSGSAVFGLFADVGQARTAADEVSRHPQAAAWQIEVVHTLAPGAFPFPAA
ncbi:MAG TPA: 4-(cytidine 5'-diphospho)-2-C-methyl-D-erythritol kinase [Deferrisomatales bacterium]|nr:4-(cytidine 5'-diphospho)-2-C-methyl-D-erythritol kinase [Deferrisomatales bacterium]